MPWLPMSSASTFQWRHNGRDSVSNHQPHDCLLRRHWPLCRNSPHKWPATRKMFPFWWRHHAWYWLYIINWGLNIYVYIYIRHLTSIWNPIVEIRHSYGRLISTLEFAIQVRWHLYIESGSWSLSSTRLDLNFLRHIQHLKMIGNVNIFCVC